MLHALVTGDTIAEVRRLKDIENDGTRDWDLRNDEDGSLAASIGWLPLVEEPRPADTPTTTWERADPALVAGVPTVQWVERDKTPEEIAADAEQNARLDDHESRIVRIEAHLWPAPPDPNEPTGVETFDELGGIWPAGGLLLEAGAVYRNVSGVPLTQPPSGFPGDPAQWGHLFVVALAPDPDPTTPDGYVGTWSAETSYAVGDVVDRDGRYYLCLVAHGAERQGTWGPGPATPTIWTDLGPV